MPISALDEQRLLETRQTILEPWLSQHVDVPEVLYHYTSSEGLIGILSSRAFWLTDLRYVNDSSELQYARDLAKVRFEARATQPNLTNIQNEFLRRAIPTLDPFEQGPSVFATSFCEDGNLLSQWRAYRGLGGGYAIGIDFFHTLRLMSKKCVLRRVVYDEARQQQLLDDLIDRFLLMIAGAYGDASVEAAEEFLPAACKVFSATVGEFLFALKHPDFREEREWRLVHFANVHNRFIRGTPMPSVRSYGGNIIPYFVADFASAIDQSKDDTFGIPFPIRELVVGPTLEGTLNEQSIRMLLLGLNRDVAPRIRRSQIPLRWL
jgi:hypothetical protein